MPRKGENIYKRKDGRWEGRYIRSYDSEHKAKYAYVYGKTYSEVKRKLTEQRGNVQKVQPTKNKSSTYGELLDCWLHSMQLNTKESTQARYTHLIKTHIKPHLGAVQLSQLTTDAIEGIHVLEHLDRLIEIFNACWPLYAAMPAILKESFERAYIKCGWDLENSIYIPNGHSKFPTFNDVLEALPEIINSSSYSSDSKGDYTGALVTRVKSLTNGISGQVLCSVNDIDEEYLFDQNTIVDLSRVSSLETKSLLMGVLILKLNEYRMCTSEENQPLRHVTVMEEAHNILKRINMAIDQMMSDVAPARSWKMSFISDTEEKDHALAMKSLNQGVRLMKTELNSLTAYQLMLKLPNEKIGRRIYVYDISGEMFSSSSDVQNNLAYSYANGFIFIIDPLTLNQFAMDVEDKVDLNAYGASSKDFDDILNIMLINLEKMFGLKDKDTLKRNLAVVINKVDIPTLEEKIGETAAQQYLAENAKTCKSYMDARDAVCRNFLEEYGAGNFVRTAEAKFKTVRYFTCSALGHNHEGQPYEGKNVVDPVMWLLQQADSSIKAE